MKKIQRILPALKKRISIKTVAIFLSVLLVAAMIPTISSANNRYYAIRIEDQPTTYYDDPNLDTIWAEVQKLAIRYGTVTLLLLDDCVASDTLSLEFGTVILDTNGFTLTTTNNTETNGIENNSSMRIIGGGKIVGSQNGDLDKALVKNTGTLLIDDVSIENNTSSPIGNAVYNAGTFIMNSGHLKCGSSQNSHLMALTTANEGTSYLLSGTLEGYSSNYIVLRTPVLPEDRLRFVYSTEPVIFINHAIGEDVKIFNNIWQVAPGDEDTLFDVTYSDNDSETGVFRSYNRTDITATQNASRYLKVQTQPISFDFWVEGVEVHTKNYKDILGESVNNVPVASYNRDEKVLTLNRSLYSENGTQNNAVLYLGENAPQDMTVQLSACHLLTKSESTNAFGIYSQKAFTLNADTYSQITAESKNQDAYGIYSKGKVTMTGANVAIEATSEKGNAYGFFTEIAETGLVIQDGAKVTISATASGTKSSLAIGGNYPAAEPFEVDASSILSLKAVGACLKEGAAYSAVSGQVILSDTNRDGTMEGLTELPATATALEIRPAVTVTLDLSAAGKDNVTLTYGKDLTLPEPSVPYVDGFLFTGWFTDANYTTAFSFDTVLSENVTLYAKFIPYANNMDDIAADLQEAVTDLQTAINEKASAAELTAAINNLNSAIATAESAAKAYADTQDTALKAALESAIATAKGEAITAAEALVDTAKSELTALIDEKASAAELTAAINTLNNAIETAETTAKAYADTQDTALKTALESAIATAKGEAITAAEVLVNTAKGELTTLINKKADSTALENAINTLNSAIEAAENTAKTYTDTQSAALKTALESAQETLQQAIDQLNASLKEAEQELQAQLDAMKAELQEKDRTLLILGISAAVLGGLGVIGNLVTMSLIRRRRS